MLTTLSLRIARGGAFKAAAWLSLAAACALLCLAIVSVNWMIIGAIIGGVTIAAFMTIGVRHIYVAWLIGIPTLFASANDYLNAIPGMTLDRLLFFLIAGMTVCAVALRKLPRLSWQSHEKTVAIFLLYLCVSMIVGMTGKLLSEIKLDLAMYVNGYLMPLGALILARRMDWTDRHISILLYSFLGVALYLSAIALLQVYFGITFFAPEYLENAFSGAVQGRVTGTFGSAAEFGCVMALLLIIQLIILRRVKDPVFAVVIVAIMGLTSVGLILGETRGPLLGFGIAICVLFIVDRTLRPLIVFGACASFAGFLVAAPFLFDFSSLAERVSEVSPIYNRLTLWASGINILIHHPLFGVGFGRYSFLHALPYYATGIFGISGNWATHASVPHNEFIHLSVFSGFLGIALFALILRFVIRSLRRTYNATPIGSVRQDIVLCAIAALVSYLVNGLVIDFGLWRFFPLLVFSLVGIALSRSDATQSAISAR